MKNILKRFAVLCCCALLAGACSDDEASASRRALEEAIRAAETLLATSTEGLEEGNIAPGSKAVLQTRIDQAYHIMNNTSWDEGYDNAVALLEAAVAAFRENIVKAGIPYFGAGSKMNLGPVGDWDLTGAFTLEMKLRFDELVGGDQNVISCEQGNAAIMIRNNGSQLQFYIFDTGWCGGTVCTIEQDRWYHIAASYEAGGRMRFYLDGKPVWSTPCGTATVVPTVDLQLGTAPSYANRYMRGNIQHLSVWADVRTDEEVAADAACALTGEEEGLKAYWPLTLNVGTEILDKTGRRTAVLTDVAWHDAEQDS
ncbi:LamG domain-containing protein [uncultured Alistipes sp.]|uniref:LamG domain-containing protein n=1 Tax=uncultured Alistipes sp. TaxID=538949 RepID=UPI00260B3A58|nr:LamG domain-containing protein [uncultured Alistipes sp.]